MISNSKWVLGMVLVMAITTTHSQLTTANNGLTATTSTNVALGGTLADAQTAIDFGSSNSNSNFLLKKGTKKYFSVANNGSVTLGDVYPNAPDEHVIYFMGGSYAGRGIKFVNTYSGSIVRMHSFNEGLYVTKDNGAAGTMIAENFGNPSDGTSLRATLGRWEINSGIFTVNQLWTGSGQYEMTIGDAARKGIIVKSAASQTGNLIEWQNSSGSPLSVITSNGSMGIGTSTPGPYQLAVEGTIGARKVKVTQASPWADFVFEKDYELPTLPEVEKFIQKNKHLPGVPSAKEVEQNGLDIGDNQAVLLKKIEELTLYVIQLQKEVEILKQKSK